MDEDAPPLIGLQSMIPGQQQSPRNVSFERADDSMNVYSTSNQSRSYATSPDKHGSTSSPTLDAPPSTSLYNMIPGSQSRNSNFASPHQNLAYGGSPIAMELDSPSVPGTPSPQTTTVLTITGYAPHLFDLILRELRSFGTFTIVKQDINMNWVVVSYLQRSSYEQALSMDGTVLEQSYLLNVRKGDAFTGIKAKTLGTPLKTIVPPSPLDQEHAEQRSRPKPSPIRTPTLNNEDKENYDYNVSKADFATKPPSFWSTVSDYFFGW
jgi:Nup53/35/40-type RNA recognition motif